MVCPQCGTLNPDERLKCFRCEHSLLPSRLAEEGVCKYHPNVPCTANCSVCGAPICEECAIRVEDVAYCPHCAAVPGDDRGPAKTERVLTPLEMTTYNYGNAGWRLLSGIIDGFLIGSGMMILAFLFWMLSGVPVGVPWAGGMNTLFWILVYFGTGFYMVGYHVTSGQTPGYMATDLLLVRKDGMALTPLMAMARFVVSLISAAFFMLGYLWMLWDPERQTWHDKVAGTIVLRIGEHKDMPPEQVITSSPSSTTETPSE